MLSYSSVFSDVIILRLIFVFSVQNKLFSVFSLFFDLLGTLMILDHFNNFDPKLITIYFYANRFENLGTYLLLACSFHDCLFNTFAPATLCLLEFPNDVCACLRVCF